LGWLYGHVLKRGRNEQQPGACISSRAVMTQGSFTRYTHLGMVRFIPADVRLSANHARAVAMLVSFWVCLLPGPSSYFIFGSLGSFMFSSVLPNMYSQKKSDSSTTDSLVYKDVLTRIGEVVWLCSLVAYDMQTTKNIV
jgi:hypothetical protein